MGSVISKEMAGVKGGCPKTCFQVFLQGNKLQQASWVKKKKMLHLFPSISVTKVSVIYFVFIILQPFLKEVLPVEQQTFSQDVFSV